MLKGYIQSLRQLLLNDPSYHIFGVVETRLGPTVEDSLIQVEGLNIVRQDRNKGGGGVALYVKDMLKVNVLPRSDTIGPGKPKVPEYLACQIWQGEGPPAPVLIVVIYRPPR